MAGVQGGALWMRVAFVVVLVAFVAGFVIWMNRPDWELRAVTEVVGSADSTLLEVAVVHPTCESGPRVRVVDEGEDAVVLRTEQNVRGDCTAERLTTTIDVELGDRLGNRRIRLQEASGGGTTCRIDGGLLDPCS